MSSEEMERTMQFILEHQAKFAANIDQINETLVRHNEAIVGSSSPGVTYSGVTYSG